MQKSHPSFAVRKVGYVFRYQHKRGVDWEDRQTESLLRKPPNVSVN